MLTNKDEINAVVEKLNANDQKEVKKAGQEMVDHGAERKVDTVGSEVYSKGPSPTPAPTAPAQQIQR